MIRSILIALLALTHAHTFSASEECDSNFPIDTQEKAWCLMEKEVLSRMSCLSLHKYHREIQEVEGGWLLSSKDEGLNGESTCRPVKIKICEDSGQIKYENENQQCGT